MIKVYYTRDLIKALDDGKQAYWNMEVQGKRFKVTRFEDGVMTLVDTKLMRYEIFHDKMLTLLTIVE